MKKLLLLFFFALSFLLNLRAQNADGGLKQAQLIYHFMVASQGDSIWSKCSPEVQKQVTAQQFGSVWNAMEMQIGKLVSAGDWQTDSMNGLTFYYRNLKFERYELRFNVAFNDLGQCVILNMVPVAPIQAESVNRRKFDNQKSIESDIIVENGKIKLPGTLTLPRIAGTKVPAVILVHGSGPGDRDESYQQLKPFQEIAWGLSEQGIAVIRYDKRTRVYKGNDLLEAGKFTYDQESVNDALAAVQLAKSIPEIDSNNVFVLGHSLGGALAPRIAQRLGDDKGLAGIISLAGATRDLEDMLNEQIAYLASFNGKQVDAKAETQKVLSSLPAEYLAMDRSYDPVATAQQLNLPFLILQGERDYQVTMEDFSAWKAGLEKKDNVSFKSYEKLNHFLQEGSGKSTPMEYVTYSPVPNYIIADIAAFIKLNVK